MAIYKTPDVFVEEISTLPPSVAEVSTAIPAFIGYTALAPDAPDIVPVRITSFLEFTTIFGGPALVNITATVKENILQSVEIDKDDPMEPHKLYYMMDLYFKNGGSDCYIISLGKYPLVKKDKQDFQKGLEALATEDEPTLIVLSEAASLVDVDYYSLCGSALDQCSKLQDRFCIFDVPMTDLKAEGKAQQFRNGIGNKNLKYGAAYHPYLNTSLSLVYDEKNVKVSDTGTPVSARSGNTSSAGTGTTASTDTGTTSSAETVSTIPAETVTTTPAETVTTAPAATGTTAPDNYTTLNNEKIKEKQTALYNSIKQALSKIRIILPPAAAIAGIYAYTDRTRGVWKAPANVSLSSVISPVIKIGASEQDDLNVDANSGKSINAIRSFIGKGTMVWGARTLAGNDNEWRYVSVRRLFIMIEESAKKASYFAVFEPNDAGTWLKVKGMIESFLYSLWQQGALAGSTTKAAYFVNIGLGTTMTTQDILEGRMIVEIGIAAVRPAEFIILRFSHKLQEA